MVQSETLSAVGALPTTEVALPTLIGGAEKPAALRFLKFFTVNIRNRNTRAACARSASAFLRWCEGRGIVSLAAVQPVHVAAYIEQLNREMSPPTVKQHLACICMLFDWLVTGQVVPANPAHAVRGLRHSVSKGLKPVLSSEETTALLVGMDASTVVELRNRAIVSVMTHTFARVGAVVALNVKDYFPQKKRWRLRLRGKNGKLNEMPCHHKLESYLDEYIKAARIEGDGKGPLFRSAIGKTGALAGKPMLRTDVWYMARRRAADAGIETRISCHTFRATGVTHYLTNGGHIEGAQRMAGHSNAKTTSLYERRNDDVSVGEVERIGI
jgi:integrase/recombinase XerD